jgi:type I restriction enzyme R subunit
MNEADTCRTYVIPKLKSAGWEKDDITEQLVLTGRIMYRATHPQKAAPDYIVHPPEYSTAVVEAGPNTLTPGRAAMSFICRNDRLKFAYSSNGKGLLSTTYY